MSKSIHVEAMCWLRYGKRMPIVCTEAGPWNADILGISSDMSIEIEVKKSKSDLKRDFTSKKAKHFAYAAGTSRWVPNYLYFYVPEELGEFAVQHLAEACPKAGVAVYKETENLDGRNTGIVKKPIRLREEPPHPGLVRTAIQRMSSQLCGQIIAFEGFRARLESTFAWTLKGGVDAAVRIAGTLDPEDREGDLRLRAAELAFCVEQIQDFGKLPPEQQQKWLDAAKRWLDAQYVTSKEWEDASYRL
jgi:hypothetical protein